jgi:hypothetical protein
MQLTLRGTNLIGDIVGDLDTTRFGGSAYVFSWTITLS